MTRQHATITISPENALFLKDRGIPLSTFVNQQIENLAKGKEEYLIYMLAVEADQFKKSHEKRVEELKKRGYSNYQSILTNFQSMIVTDETKKLKRLYDALFAIPPFNPKLKRQIEGRKPSDLNDPNKIPEILSWIENRAPELGINRPASWVLDQLQHNGFGEAKA